MSDKPERKSGSGGKRAGSGRKVMPDAKPRISVRVTPFVKGLLDSDPTPLSEIIDNAIKNYYEAQWVTTMKTLRFLKSEGFKFIDLSWDVTNGVETWIEIPTEDGNGRFLNNDSSDYDNLLMIRQENTNEISN